MLTAGQVLAIGTAQEDHLFQTKIYRLPIKYYPQKNGFEMLPHSLQLLFAID